MVKINVSHHVLQVILQQQWGLKDYVSFAMIIASAVRLSAITVLYVKQLRLLEQ